MYRVVTGCEDARARDGPGAGPAGPLAARERCRAGMGTATHVRAIQPDIKDGVSTPETYAAFLILQICRGVAPYTEYTASLERATVWSLY